jgi:hypothetical protein
MTDNFARPAARGLVLAVAGVVGLAVAAPTLAASSDTQTVSFTISSISEINVSNTAVSLTVGAATAGSQPSDGTATSTYDITTNASQNGKKITASLSANMPDNVTLKVSVTPPTGASSPAGSVTLSTTAADVVTGLQGVAEQGLAIGYTLSATVAAAATSGSRTVTYTVVDL